MENILPSCFIPCIAAKGGEMGMGKNGTKIGPTVSIIIRGRTGF